MTRMYVIFSRRISAARMVEHAMWLQMAQLSAYAVSITMEQPAIKVSLSEYLCHCLRIVKRVLWFHQEQQGVCVVLITVGSFV